MLHLRSFRGCAADHGRAVQRNGRRSWGGQLIPCIATVTTQLTPRIPDDGYVVKLQGSVIDSWQKFAK